MSSDEELSYDDRVKEEQLSPDDGPNDFGNQTHEFQDDPEDDIFDASDQEAAPFQSSGSEDAPSHTPLILDAAGRDQLLSDDEKSLDGSRSPRKRRARSSLSKAHDVRPLKRVKGTFNRAYLDLLNFDIQDAAAQYIPDDERPSLRNSQVGLILWTSTEKEIFFESLGRLGRDDATGIASRIRTKGVMEVRQYMKLLDDALTKRQQQNELDLLELADFPSAVEIGEECSGLLEDAADSLARRQENHEEAVERQKWGDDFLLTAENYEELEKGDGQEHQSGSLTVFDLPVWLKLSETVFMNSAQKDKNWRYISGELPSIRLTTLEDFYSLVLSVTTRLMESASYIAESRIRSKKALHPTRMSNLVKRKDVEAAVASLGLRSTRTNFWGKCPRRLGLDVHEEKPHRKDTEAQPIPYDDVEEALGVTDEKHSSHQDWEGGSISSDSSISEATEREDTLSSSWDSEDEEIKNEANEVLLHSAVDRPQTTRERQTLVAKIKAERERETHAEAIDAYATYKEEKRMWRLQAKEPSKPLEKPAFPEIRRRSKASVGDVYSAGQRWRQHLQYVSEWEHDVDM